MNGPTTSRISSGRSPHLPGYKVLQVVSELQPSSLDSPAKAWTEIEISHLGCFVDHDRSSALGTYTIGAENVSWGAM